MIQSKTIFGQARRVWLGSAFLGVFLLALETLAFEDSSIEVLFMIPIVSLFAILFSIPSALILVFTMLLVADIENVKWRYRIVAIVSLVVSIVPFVVLFPSDDLIIGTRLGLVLPFAIAVQLMLASERGHGVFRPKHGPRIDLPSPPEVISSVAEKSSFSLADKQTNSRTVIKTNKNN